MLVPMSWIKKYVQINIPVEELAHILTMAGTEVGSVTHIGQDWPKEKIVIGSVLSVEPHPNADRLTLPTIDLGNDEVVKVVCGAPNIAAGQKIAFAKEGSPLINVRSGKLEPLKTATIRGIVSAGMVCSEQELGLSDNHEGILILDDDATIGAPLVDYIGDSILDLELTPNRPDCLSMLGVAHEIGALTEQEVSEPTSRYREAEDKIQDKIDIEISDPSLCNRYSATLLTGIQVGPSPKWLQNALSLAGQRTINNVVDATNYVMLEYGQPIHAFDFDKIRDKTVVVRTAHDGEKMLSLDGDNLTLKPNMLVISDSKTPIALAGIIGGKNTSVTNKTSTILVEAANFDASSVRRTRTELGINTEASYRFERGPRQELVPIALHRVTKMILDIAGGQVKRNIMDLYPNPKQVPAVSISSDRIKAVLGVTLDIDSVKNTLINLGFRQSTDDKLNNFTLKMEVPYWRSDISIEEDLIEEVARIKGYDSIPTTMPSTPIPHHKPQPFIQFRETLRDQFVSAGMQEIISYSATSLNSLKTAKSYYDNKPPIKISNPISSELEYMRTTLRSGVLETLSYNHRNSRGKGIKIFEIGRVYLPKTKGEKFNLPEETEMLVGAITGPRSPVTWLAPEEKFDFYDAKGLLESVFSGFSLDSVYQTSEDPLMHPGKTARILCGSIPIGVVGEIQASFLTNLELHDDPVILFEFNLKSLFQNIRSTDFTYSSISKFPDSERDLALLIDSTISSDDVQIVINRHKLVSTSTAFDLYTGSGIPAHKKSLAFRVVFQSSKATLTTAQIDKAQQDIMNQLKREFGAELRE